MKRRTFALKKTVCLLTLAGLTAPALLRADCLPSAPSGYTAPFLMATLKNFNSGSQSASYAAGSFVIGTSTSAVQSGTTFSAANVQELFSNRTTCPDSSGSGIHLCTPSQFQPFDINQADTLGITISDIKFSLELGGPVGINVTLEPKTGAKQSFAGSCNAATGELFGTFEGNTFVVITFGTPEPPATTPPPPK